MIEEALTGARAELAALQARQSELELPRAEQERMKMTLHDAMSQVLRENNNEWMTVRALADAVNTRRLYRKRDGSPVEINQVHARANNYASMFEKDGANIRLRRESPMLTALPQSATVFRDDDSGFFEWLDENPGGYFINSERNPRPTYLVLHRPSCPHFKGSPKLKWTKDYVKVCSSDRVELEEWASETVGGEVTLCRTCFG